MWQHKCSHSIYCSVEQKLYRELDASTYVSVHRCPQRYQLSTLIIINADLVNTISGP